MDLGRGKIKIDTNLADGQINGLSATGALLVSMVYAPVFRRLIGTEGDEELVTEWHVSPAGMRRIAAMAAWRASEHDYPTAGSA